MTVSRSALFAILPPIWPHDVLPDIRTEIAATDRQLVILDDDPTGIHTVHDVAVVTRWDIATLRAELARRARGFFILTNSRSLPPAAARSLTLELARRLREAARAEECAFTLVSRSDSALRGHFPLEPDALGGSCGPFDATLLAPYFEAAGRCTIGDVHYVTEGDTLVPVAETAFARDAVFGFRSSDLRAWVEEKTGGRVPASAVRSISLETIRRGGPHAVLHALLDAPRGAYVVVNAAAPRDLDVVVLAALRTEAAGRRLLYRCAAEFVGARLALAPRPDLTGSAVVGPEARHGGLIVAGSHLPRTTEQIEQLRATHRIHAIELDATTLLDSGRATATIQRAAHALNAALAAGDDTLLFTSRRFISGADATAHFEIGARLAQAVSAIVHAVTVRPRYLIAKGGITANEVATRGLGVHRAIVRGQLLPGVPVWHLGAEAKFPGMNYVVFPGNVGSANSLAEAVTRLHQTS